MRDDSQNRGTEPADRAAIAGSRITENIYFCPDGKYRWVYEYSMLKNPVILLSVCKVLLVSLLIAAAFVTALNLIDGNPIFKELSDMEKTGLTVTGIALLACVLIAYLVVGKSKGFQYCVLFEMSEDSIVHKELPQSYQKTQALSELVFLAGAAANRPGVAGAGLLAASRSELATTFRNVRRLKSLKRFHTIKLDAPFSHNQIYAEAADYDFVLDFISNRIPKSKSKP